MFFENGSSPLRSFIARIGFPVDEGFGDRNIFLALQRFDVRSEASIGHADHLLQRVKIVRFIGHQYRHNLEADAVLQYLIQIFKRILHRSYLL